MVMYSITSKLNLTFAAIGKATFDKMTAKVGGKMCEELISTCCHGAKHVCEILNIFWLLHTFFPHPE